MFAVLQYSPRKKTWKIVPDTVRPDKKTAESMADVLNSLTDPQQLKSVSVKQLYKTVRIKNKDLKTN